MKTPMTAGRWWEEVGCSKYAHTDASTEDIARMAFVAGQANSPQPQWQKWSDSKPMVENEWGAKSVLVEVINADDVSEQISVCLVETLLNQKFWFGWTRIAWLYILPSGFAPKQKDEAEVAWQKWSDTYYLTMPLTPVILKDKWIEAFNLGRAKAKQ